MSYFLKQSTAVVISFGPFVDKTDGVTLEVGLVSALDHGTTGIMLSKNGGALAVRHATVTATTYDAHGCYLVTLDTTDTATLGGLRVIYTDAATCLPVWRDFMVIPATMYDNYGAASGGSIPAAVAGASTGLLISGSNAGTTTLGALTITGVTTHTGATVHTGNVSMAAGLTITQSTGNGHAISATGNGTGAGMYLIGGATGPGLLSTGGGNHADADGIRAVAGGALAEGLQSVETDAIKTKTDYLPSATAGAAGGVFIAGTNAALTVTGATVLTGNVSMAAGLTITQSTTNGHGISATGNGNGVGMLLTGGSSGGGMTVSAGGSNTYGARFNGAGSAAGMYCIGGATAPGLIGQGGGNAATAHGIQGVAGGALANHFEGWADDSMGVGADTGAPTKRTYKQAFRMLRNKWSVDGTKLLTVTKEDDATASWTSQLTTNVAAEPITASDPASA